jgi:hypothetical protein
VSIAAAAATTAHIHLSAEAAAEYILCLDVIRPEVGDYPWGVILIVRGVVWYSNGVFYHVRVLTVVSLLNNLRATDRGLIMGLIL